MAIEMLRAIPVSTVPSTMTRPFEPWFAVPDITAWPLPPSTLSIAPASAVAQFVPLALELSLIHI